MILHGVHTCPLAIYSDGALRPGVEFAGFKQAPTSILPTRGKSVATIGWVNVIHIEHGDEHHLMLMPCYEDEDLHAYPLGVESRTHGKRTR